MAAAAGCARPDSLRYVEIDVEQRPAVVIEEGLVALDLVLVLFVLGRFDGRRAGGNRVPYLVIRGDVTPKFGGLFLHSILRRSPSRCIHVQ